MARSRRALVGLSLVAVSFGGGLLGGAEAGSTCLGETPTLTGTDGPDRLTGGPGEDVIAGGPGDDVITGLDKNDVLCGGAGNDRFPVDRDNDMIDGGSGRDTVDFAASEGVGLDLGVRATRGSAAATGRDALGTDALIDIEDAIGSPSVDRLAGGPGANRLEGGDGADTFVYYPTDSGRDRWNGGGGDDTAEYERAPGSVSVDLVAGTASVASSRTGTDRVEGIEHVNGSFFADVIKGDGAANLLSGNIENPEVVKLPVYGLTGDDDVLEGRGGDDGLHVATGRTNLDGGDGNDVLEATPHKPVVMSGGAGNDTLSSEALSGDAPYEAAGTYSGGPGSDVIRGTNGNDTLSGDGENDELYGLDGDDALVGGPGESDSGFGDSGSDVCETIETAQSCLHDGKPDDGTTDASFTPITADISVTIEGAPSDTEGAYLLRVQNAGPDATHRVRLLFYFTGRVPRPPDDCALGDQLGRAEVVCFLSELAPGARKEFIVEGDEAHLATHMAVVAHAPQDFQPGPPNDPDWSNNIAIRQEEPTLAVTGLEVTQGIQNLRGEMPLIAGRKTWVRVHMRTMSGSVGPVRPRLHAVDLTGNRRAEFSASNVPYEGVPPGELTIQSEQNRQLESGAFLFELPREWWTGNVQFRIDVPRFEFLCNDPRGDCQMPALFRPGPTIHLQLVGLPWEDDAGAIHRPGFRDMAAVANQVRTLFPVANVRWIWAHDLEPWWLPDDSPSRSRVTMERLRGTVRLDRWRSGCDSSLSPNCFEVGVLTDLPEVGAGTAGLSDVPSDAVIAYLGRRLDVGHELGHAVGRMHTRCTEEDAIGPGYPYSDGQIGVEAIADHSSPAAYWGADVYRWGSFFDPPAKPYFHAHRSRDLMSWCNSDMWISHHTYAAIRTALEARFGTGSPRAGAAAATSPALIVTGVTGPGAGANEIASVDRVGSADVEIGEGTHSVRMFDAAGSELARRAFTPQPAEGGEHDGFSLALPDAPGMARLALYAGEEELHGLALSANAPQVTVLSPDGGEALRASQVTVKWRGVDPDGDRLTYAVDYSADNGTTWTTAALEVRGSSVQVPRARLGGAQRALFRVTASDGLRSAADVSDAPFRVANNRPDVVLDRSVAHRVFLRDQTVSLNADVGDAEDGSLEGGAVRWRSGRRVLGTGPYLTLRAGQLGLGSRVITVDARDSDGGRRTAKLHLTVFRKAAAIPRCRGSYATLLGTRGRDVIRASGRAVIMGAGGADRLRGSSARDAICGGRGRDRIDGRGGRDNCVGGPGRDRLKGCERAKQ